MNDIANDVTREDEEVFSISGVIAVVEAVVIGYVLADVVRGLMLI